MSPFDIFWRDKGKGLLQKREREERVFLDVFLFCRDSMELRCRDGVDPQGRMISVDIDITSCFYSVVSSLILSQISRLIGGRRYHSYFVAY